MYMTNADMVTDNGQVAAECKFEVEDRKNEQAISFEGFAAPDVIEALVYAIMKVVDG